MPKVKEPPTPREELSQEIEQARLSMEQLAGEKEQVQQKYKAAIRRGDSSQAQQMKLRSKQLADESEIAQDRLRVLESRWPGIEKAESAEKLPLMIEQYEHGVVDPQQASTDALEAYLDGLEARGAM